MTERIRAALRDLMDDVDQYSVNRDVCERAEAALAEQVAERPPAVTIGALLHPAYEPGDGSADGAQMVGMQWWHPVMGCDSLQIVVDNARAVLARYGNHFPGATKMVSPAPASSREVAELVEFLRIYGDEVMDEYGDVGEHDQLTRAADLLEQRHPAPVPVSERLPAMVTDGLRVAGDCDEQGRCWAGTRAFVDTSGDRDIDYPPSWELREVCAQDDVWLPAHALPLPAGEVQP